jgi:hypothetical protein
VRHRRLQAHRCGRPEPVAEPPEAVEPQGGWADVDGPHPRAEADDASRLHSHSQRVDLKATSFSTATASAMVAYFAPVAQGVCLRLNLGRADADGVAELVRFAADSVQYHELEVEWEVEPPWHSLAPSTVSSSIASTSRASRPQTSPLISGFRHRGASLRRAVLPSSAPGCRCLG